MESSSPESPSKKRKHHSNRRDPPLFESRRSRPTLQQPPEFLTESINTSRNTSYIPSPIESPDKSPTRESFRARPRQVVDRKALARTSSHTTPNISNENLPPHSSRSPSRLSRTKPGFKVPSIPINRAQSYSHPPTHPDVPKMSFTPARTPSPPRGRSMIAESPVNSESSPGRGYAEAYQRIVEEENLAHEDSIDDLELEDANFQEDEPQDPGRLRAKDRITSASSGSLRTLRKTSPRESIANEPAVEETEKDEGTIDQESISESVPAENETQTSAGSGSSQYARDIQRLNSALKGNGQPFSRARGRHKAGSVTQSLRHSNGSDESLGSTLSSGNLSRHSDPSVNIPKAWGRKSKPGKDWLNRINNQSGRLTGDVPKGSPSSEQLIARHENRAGQKSPQQSNGDNDVPLPGSSSRLNGSSRGSTPRTTFQRSTPLDRKPQWGLNEDDFTGRSLQVSESPPMRIRNTDREGVKSSELADQRLATSRKDGSGQKREPVQNTDLLPFEIEQDSFSESSPERNVDLDRLTQNAGAQALLGVDDSVNELQSPHDHNEATPDSIHEEMGEPIPDTPIVVYRNSEEHRHTGSTKSDRQGESDSLLRRLARVSSQSPSPAKDLDEAKERSVDGAKESKSEQTPHQSKVKIDKRTPIITGAWIDQTPGPPPPASESKAVLKTPFITGGWIETPLPTGGRGLPMPTPLEPENGQELGTTNVGASELITKLNTTTPRPPLKIQEPLKYTGPPLPKSALEEIINDARAGKLKDTRPDLDFAEEPTLNLGDSTIQSLEDLIANDTDYSTLLATSQETSPPSSDPSPSSKTTGDPPTEPQDPQSYTNLLTRLRNLAPSIRASSRQIASVERTLATTHPTSLRRTRNADGDDDECHEAGEFHDFIWPCPRCNCPGRPPPTTSNALTAPPSSNNDNPPLIPLATLSLTLPALWYFPPLSPDSQLPWLPRLTRLGALALAIYTYFFLENLFQLRYCHPQYAHTMVGYGVDIHAPRPPFVMFQMIGRKLGLGLGGWWGVVRGLMRVLGGLVGWVLGVVVEVWGGGGEGGEGGGGMGKQPVSRDQRIPRPRWGPDLSMFDDEFL